MLDIKTFPKWYTLIWSAKTLFKKSNNVFFSTPTSPIFLSKPLQYDFVINKINFIVLINIAFFMKKIQDFNINSTNFLDLLY